MFECLIFKEESFVHFNFHESIWLRETLQIDKVIQAMSIRWAQQKSSSNLSRKNSKPNQNNMMQSIICVHLRIRTRRRRSRISPNIVRKRFRII